MTEYTLEDDGVRFVTVNLPRAVVEKRTFLITMPSQVVSNWRVSLGNRVILWGFKIAGIYGSIEAPQLASPEERTDPR